MKKLVFETESREDIKKEILQRYNYNVDKILDTLIDYVELYNQKLENEVKQEPIVISQEDFNKITSIFRIRGYKCNDSGMEVEKERRGRKPGIPNKPKTKVD